MPKPPPDRIALSYVNTGIVHHADGRISARPFFRERGRNAQWMQASVDQMWRGGVRLVVLSHGVNDVDLLPGAAGIDYVLRQLEACLSEIEASDRCALVRSGRDLRRAERENKIAILLHLTGCPINESLQVLDVYARLGVRGMHPIVREAIYGGEWKEKFGLTALGKAVIRRMQELRMVVDTAHMSDQSFSDTLKITRGPLMDSHTGCRAIVDKARNRSDAQIARMGERGGFVGVHFDSKLLTDVGRDPRLKALEKMQVEVARLKKRHAGDTYGFLAARYDPQRWSKALGGAKDDGIEPRRATIADVCDHLERMVDLAGPRHVGLGTDYALGSICGGVESADKLPALAEALRKRGRGERVVHDVLYRNLRRLLMAVLPAA